MRKIQRLISLSYILCTAAIAAKPAAPAVYECEYKIGRGCISGWARVSIENGRIQNVESGSYFCIPSGEHGYSCTADAKRGDGKTQWEDRRHTVRITLPEEQSNPAGAHSMTVSMTSDGIKIVTSNIWPDACSMGAALPEWLFISVTSKKCAVKFDMDPQEYRDFKNRKFNFPKALAVPPN